MTYGVGKPPFLVPNRRHMEIVRPKHVAALQVGHWHAKLDFENPAAAAEIWTVSKLVAQVGEFARFQVNKAVCKSSSPRVVVSLFC